MIAVSGSILPGYFNEPSVLKAERAGLEVCDAVLGHVLKTEPDKKVHSQALALLALVQNRIVPNEVVSRCHNLHGAVMLMLDKIGCPSVVIWGSINASAEGTAGFVLNATLGTGSPDHRPGHSWLLSPYWTVADLALRWQQGSGVGDDYDALQSQIPPLVLSESRESSEPEKGWWRYPVPSLRFSEENYANETKYQDVLGWTKVEVGRLVLRYLPGAVAIPQEPDLNHIDILVGGMRPGDFFESIQPELP